MKHFINKKVPLIVSVLLHPMLMPSVGTLFILFFSGLYITMLPQQAKQLILLIVCLCTLALPLSLLLFYKYRHIITDLYISERRERIMPLVFTAIFYYLAYQVLHYLHTPYIIQKFVLASTIGVFLTSIISFHWKISIHGVGIGGITGMMAALAIISPALLPGLLIAILLCGVVAYARIRLNAHTPTQMYIGILLGFGVTFGMFFLV